MLVPPIQGERFSALTNVPDGIQPAHLYGYHIFNQNASTVFIQFFNASSSDVIAGVTVPDYVFPVPASVGATSPGVAQIQWVRPLLFNLGVSMIAATTPSGGVAPASSVDVTIFVDEE